MATSPPPPSRPNAGRQLSTATFLVAALLLVLAGLRLGASNPIGSGFVVPLPQALADRPVRDDYVVNPDDIAHAAAAIVGSDGNLRVFWYEGSDEAAPDVRIFSNTRTATGWSAPMVVADAVETGAAEHRFVRFLGNATIVQRPNGEYWLFYVSVSLGGWSGAELNLRRSPDGEVWGPPKRLYASPFFNRASLVRAPPLALRDGRIALPVYDESAGEYPELLIIDRDGSVAGRVRMGGGGRTAIQPWVVVLDETRAVAFMRSVDDDRPFLWRTETTDSGAHWSPIAATNLPNPNSPVSVVKLEDGRLLLAGNLSANSNSQLGTAISADAGKTWTTLQPTLLEGRPQHHFFRYPWLVSEADGSLHLFVSEYRGPLDAPRSIRHLVLGPKALGLPPP